MDIQRQGMLDYGVPDQGNNMILRTASPTLLDVFPEIQILVKKFIVLKRRASITDQVSTALQVSISQKFVAVEGCFINNPR